MTAVASTSTNHSGLANAVTTIPEQYVTERVG